MSLNSRRKLKPRDVARLTAGDGLWSELVAVVCATGVLPEKEWHECWQMALRVHQVFPENLRVVDLAAGHGLLAWILVLLGRTAAEPIARTAVAVDIQRPPSADILANAIRSRWPQWADTVHFVEGSIDAVTATPGSQTLFVANHACGSLSDRVLLAAIHSQNPVAIMPCCHSHRKQVQTLEQLSQISGREAPASTAAIDGFRIDALASLGYEILEDAIAAEISGFPRIIMGKVSDQASALVGKERAGISMKRRGTIRAFESLSRLDASNLQEIEALAERPSRMWRRSFDLSFWVRDEAAGEDLACALATTSQQYLQDAASCAVVLRNRYIDPGSGRLSFTYRIDLSSVEKPFHKADGLQLRQHLCDNVTGNFQLRT